ncbi:MAG: RNA replicase beta chain, partial [Sanya fiers-like virus 54]
MKIRENLCETVMSRLIKRSKLPNHLLDGPFREDGTLKDCADVDEFRKSYLIYSLLRKYQGGGSEDERISTATSAWYAAEKQCFSTNVRLDSIDPRILPFISNVQKKILDIIGSEPDVEIIGSLCRWGPGATFDIRRSHASVLSKTTRQISVTKRALPHLLRVIDEKWAEALGTNGFRVVRGNRCVMVPKSASTHRTIAAEPTGNSFLQSGVGRYFRARLKLFGVDLDDQTINQCLAKIAVAFNLATIDLSMASDTLCRALVDLLLPPRWVAFLNDLRSPYSFFQGKWVRLEKFSSMGNGFTFELETMIFWALCSEICGNELTYCYGDDIIVPCSKAEEVILALRFFGFTPNKDKSFVSGRFRESCGKHYLDGIEVTPVYQKKKVGDLFEMIRFHNRLLRWGLKYGLLHIVRDSAAYVLEKSKAFCKRGVPYIPYGMQGDDGFLSDLTIKEGKKYLLYIERPKLRRNFGCDLGPYAYKLRNPTAFANTDPRGYVCHRPSTERVFIKRVLWASNCLTG